MSGTIEQSYKQNSYQSTMVTVKIQNAYRTLTAAEIQAANELLEAAERYSKMFYPDGDPRNSWDTE